MDGGKQSGLYKIYVDDFQDNSPSFVSSCIMRERLDQTSFRLNRQAARTKNATIQTISTPNRRPGEYHEGLGIIPAPVLDETGPMVTPMSDEYTSMGLNSCKM